jgi:hypothetical protein
MGLINRKPFVNTFAESSAWGEHDEVPVLPEESDPQVYASRSAKPQPFYLTCEKDTLLVFMSGTAEVKLKHPDVTRFKVVAGDFVYVPARTPHQVVPTTQTIHYRYRAREAGKEAVSWYCAHCGTLLSSHVWDTATVEVHSAFQTATAAFNQSADMRTCKTCGLVNDKADASGNRWSAIATEARGAV